MTWGWSVRNEPLATGGAVGTPAEAKVPGAWMDYEAKYLKQRLETENGRFGSNPLQGEAKGVYLDKVSQNYKDEAEACLKKEFAEWLQGNHEANIRGALGELYAKGVNVPMTAPNRRHVYDGNVGTPKDDWVPTDWGRAQLTHLPGVRDWLRSQREHSDRAELDMNLLAEHGPQNLEQAWMYFKHWVKHRPVDVDECVEQKYADYDKSRFIRAPGGPMLPTYNRTNKAPLIDRGNDEFFGDIFDDGEGGGDGGGEQGNDNGVGTQRPTPMTAAIGSRATPTTGDASTGVDLTTTEALATQAALKSELARLEAEKDSGVADSREREASLRLNIAKLDAELRRSKDDVTLLQADKDYTTTEALATQAALKTELAQLEAEKDSGVAVSREREASLHLNIANLETELRRSQADKDYLNDVASVFNFDSSILRAEMGGVEQLLQLRDTDLAATRSELARLQAEIALGMAKSSESSAREAQLRNELQAAEARVAAYMEFAKESFFNEQLLSEELRLLEDANDVDVNNLSASVKNINIVLIKQMEENKRMQAEIRTLTAQLSEAEAEGKAEGKTLAIEMRRVEDEIERGRGEVRRTRAAAVDLLQKVQTYDTDQQKASTDQQKSLTGQLKKANDFIRVLEAEVDALERELRSAKNNLLLELEPRVSMTGGRLTSKRAAARDDERHFGTRPT